MGERKQMVRGAKQAVISYLQKHQTRVITTDELAAEFPNMTRSALGGAAWKLVQEGLARQPLGRSTFQWTGADAEPVLNPSTISAQLTVLAVQADTLVLLDPAAGKLYKAVPLAL